MDKVEMKELLSIPDEELEIGVKYNGETLYGYYEIQDSSGEWHRTIVLINSQEELDELVIDCNQYSKMNLLGFKCAGGR